MHKPIKTVSSLTCVPVSWIRLIVALSPIYPVDYTLSA